MPAGLSASEVTTVQCLLERCDVEGLKHLLRENFDWNQGLGEAKVAALAFAISSFLYKAKQQKESMRRKHFQMLEWMLRSGADASIEMSSNHEFSIWRPPSEATTVSLSFNGQSTISFVLKLSELFQLRHGGANWSWEIKYLQDVIALITRAKSPMLGSKVGIHADVVCSWEIAREMTSTHNVVFQTADREISAHDHILVAASPVLEVMLESTMREGSSKCIPVKDSSSNGVALFLDLLYTSSTCLDLDYKTMPVAFDLAHRWQVPHVVDLLADALQKELTVDSFVEIAETAVLKGTRSLQQACATFGAKHDEIQAKKATMPPELWKLLGVSDTSSAKPGNIRRRRF